MSTKDWKNGELTTLLSEAWGFGFKVDRLTEAGDPTGIESSDEEGEEKAKESLKGDDKGKEGMETLDEDSGEEEKHHYEHNAWNDEDHIEAIEKHLRALKHDKDYDEDHEELEERRARGRASARNQRGPADPRQRTENLARVQEIVSRVVKQLKEKQKNG